MYQLLRARSGAVQDVPHRWYLSCGRNHVLDHGSKYRPPRRISRSFDFECLAYNHVKTIRKVRIGAKTELEKAKDLSAVGRYVLSMDHKSYTNTPGHPR